MMRVRGTWMVVASMLAIGGCADTTDGDGIVTTPADFEVRAGVEIATVFGADAGVPLTLYSPEGDPLVTVVSDDLGQAHFAYVPVDHVVIESGDASSIPIIDGTTVLPGEGYVIRDDSADPAQQSEPFDVLSVDDIPSTSLYESQTLTGVHTAVLGGLAPGQKEADGFQYIEMRDGTKLSVMVRLPDPNMYGDGPYPTVVEYSGYSTSKPSGPEPGSLIANLLGYATVGVNMRGTGCSGGVFDVFNPAQHSDGYDVIETVARQDWVKGGRVGMVGLSYSGIAQLYVAATRPPSLAAITPLSTIADAWEMQWPGGIYNSGFTRQWLEARDQQASAGGMDWVTTQIESGDTQCADNLDLRAQNIDFESFLHGMEFRPDSADGRSLPELVPQIEVPVYHTGAFQDEQTGALFADMFDDYDSAPVTKMALYNGRHPDGYSPLVLTRWFEFLEFYVHGRVPRIEPVVRAAAGAEFSNAFGAPGLGFEDDRFLDFEDDDYAGALAAYESEPKVRVLFENGAGHETPGAPLGRFEANYDAWPPPEAAPTRWYLDADGHLADAPGSRGADAYRFDPAAGSTTFFGPRGYELSAPLWDINWTEFAEGEVLSYLTDPFQSDTVIAGAGYADLWIRSDVEDAAVQVTLTEVRPDGIETLVQSGWLRLGHRQLQVPDNSYEVARSYKKADFAPMPTGEYVQVRVQIPAVAHAFRADSQLRVLISAPGRNHGLWEFEAPAYDSPPVFAIEHGGEQASMVMMPTVAGVPVKEGLPPCPSLRGQPCREYRAVNNSTAG